MTTTLEATRPEIMLDPHRVAKAPVQPPAPEPIVAPQPENYRQPIFVSSIIATTVVFLLGVGIPAWFAYGPAMGLGLGGMCAFWGGPSFGVMVGSARVLLFEEKHGIHHHP